METLMMKLYQVAGTHLAVILPEYYVLGKELRFLNLEILPLHLQKLT